MAITRQDVGDISAMSVDGNSVLTTIRNVNIELSSDTDEGRGIAYLGKSPNTVKQSYKISTSIQSAISAATRVSNLDVTVFTIGAVDYLPFLRGGSISGSYDKDEAGGVGNLWKYPIPTVKDYSGEVTLNLPNSATANALRTILKNINDSATAHDTIVAITINAIAISLDMHITSFKFNGEPGKLQTVTISLAGKDDGSNPVNTPVGTTTLLEKAFNVYKTPIAFSFTSKTSTSLTLAGEMVFSSFSFSFNDAQIISTDYEWESHGVVTATQNA